MDIEQLKRFVEVGRRLNFTKAADALFITQPTLSHSIAQLEKELGTALFYRMKKSVQLTPAGALFLPRAMDLTARYDAAMDELHEHLSCTEQTLSIGLSGVSLNRMLSDWLRRFQEENPDLKIQIHRFPTNDFPAEFQTCRCDLFFMYDLNFSAPDFHARKLFSERFDLLLSADHPLAGAEAVDLTDLGSEPLLVRNKELSYFYYDRVMSICRKRKFHPTIVNVNGSYSMVHQMVGMGMGAAILSRPATLRRTQEASGTKYVPISDSADLINDVLFAWKGTLSQSGKRLLDLIEGELSCRK